MSHRSSEQASPSTNLPLPLKLESQNHIDRAPASASSRILETTQLYPGFVIPLTVLTAMLLAVELGFAGRLLDAIGRPISERQLENLAAWGWGLTAAASALLAWGVVIFPWSARRGWPQRRLGLALLISAVICAETVYLAGPALAAYFMGHMGPDQRRCAVQLRALAMMQPDGTTALPSRWLLADVPSLGLSCNGLPAVSQQGIGQALAAMVSSRIGTGEQVYNNAFIPSVRSLRDAYNDYVAAQQRLVAAVHAIPDQQSQAWQEYLNRLSDSGSSPKRVPRRDWSTVSTEVRDSGVPVPLDWNPSDKATFMDAVAISARQAADASYNAFVLQRFHVALAPGLDWDQFYGQAEIQARWKTVVGAPAGAALAPNMGFSDFSQTVYQPVVQALVAPARTRLLTDPAAFGPDKPYEQAGNAAVRWVVIPSLLLQITVLFAFWHAARLLGLAWWMSFPRAPTVVRRGVRAVCIVLATLIVIAMWWSPLSPASVAATGNAVSAAAPADSALTGGSARALAVLRIVGDAARRTVLADLDFGYQPALASDTSETGLAPFLPDFTAP
ncbi:MAG TPA: hypothetical protein VMB73_30820 [Acetobacteraceae bacterium]|nr:hypothetical protein [Acetobacteraceae bacterium]